MKILATPAFFLSEEDACLRTQIHREMIAELKLVKERLKDTERRIAEAERSIERSLDTIE